MSYREQLRGVAARAVNSACEEVIAARGDRNEAAARISDSTEFVRRLLSGPAETDRFTVTPRVQHIMRINQTELRRYDPDLYAHLLARYGSPSTMHCLVIKEKS